MTKQEFSCSMKAMLRKTDFDKLIEKAMNCGAIDVENQDPDDFTTRKALLHVMLRSAADQWEPLTPSGIEEVKNLEHFI